MYSKYEISVGKYFFEKEINSHLTSGRKIYNERKQDIESVLEKYILPDGALNGDMMKEEWFKTKKYDVFLSHSHKDINKVKAFSGWLYDTFGLTCFIDSCAWRYCDDLLKKIDDKYCWNKTRDMYDYNRRNYSTSHVHMMLSTALTEVMNLSECVMFFNTPNAVSLVDDLDYIKNRKNTQGKERVVISPWIYHELAMSSFVKQTTPDRLRKKNAAFVEHSEIRADELEIQHSVSDYLGEMKKLTDQELQRWSVQYGKRKREHPLDVLYEQNNIKGE